MTQAKMMSHQQSPPLLKDVNLEPHVLLFDQVSMEIGYFVNKNE
jgi:hypothetical protein